MKKRIGVMVTCFVVFLALLAMGIKAEAATSVTVKNFDDLKKYLESTTSYEIVLGSKIAIPSKVNVKGTKSIKGNGYTLYRKDTYAGGMFSIGNGVSLTIKGTTAISGNSGNIKGVSGSVFSIQSGGKLTLNEGIDLYNVNSKISGGAIYNQGSLIINGGKFHGCYSAGNGGIIYMAAGAKTTINQGNFYNSSCDLKGGAIYISPNSVLTLNGGTIYNNTAKSNGQGIANYHSLYLGGDATVMTEVYVAEKAYIYIPSVWNSVRKIKLTTPVIPGKVVVNNGADYAKKFEWSSYFTSASANPLTAYNSHIVVGAYYTISYNPNGGSSTPAPQKKLYGSNIKLLSTKITRVGYAFTGWFDKATGGSNRTGQEYKVNANLSLYAQWKAENYTVTFDGNTGKTPLLNKLVTFQSTYGGLPIPEKTGYRFLGWYTAQTGGTMVSASTKVTLAKNHTLYARWGQENYQVTFDYQGGSVGQTSKIVTYDQAYGSLPITEKAGHTFEGWYLDLVDEGSRIEESRKVTIPVNHILYAKFTPKTYKVLLDLQGGKGSETYIHVIYGETFKELPVPTKIGYSFGGWYTAKEEGLQVKPTDLVSELNDLTLYAHWNVERYQVYFNATGGTVGVKKTSVVYEGTYGNLPVPIRKGYDFVGWYTSTTGGSKCTATSKVGIAKDHTIYARWEKIKVIKLEVSGLKRTYYTGERLNTSNVKLLVTYADGSSKQITSGYKIKEYKTSAGTRTVVFSYEEGTCEVSCSWLSESIIQKLKMKHSSVSMDVGGTTKLSVNTTYILDGCVTYKSSNSKIAKVNSRGEVTALKGGTAKITVTIKVKNSTKKLTVTIKVKKPELKISYRFQSDWRKLKFQAQISGSNVSATWYSKNTKVATIDKKTGELKAIKSGVTYITAKSGTTSKKVKVVVKAGSGLVIVY